MWLFWYIFLIIRSKINIKIFTKHKVYIQWNIFLYVKKRCKNIIYIHIHIFWFRIWQCSQNREICNTYHEQRLHLQTKNAYLILELFEKFFLIFMMLYLIIIFECFFFLFEKIKIFLWHSKDYLEFFIFEK